MLHSTPGAYAPALLPRARHRSCRGEVVNWLVAALVCTFLSMPPALAQREPSGDGQQPLTAEQLVTEVVQRNPGLAAQRAALTEAAAHIKPAGSLDDPMLSVGVAPGTLGTGVGAGEEVQVSQALPWWGTLSARRAAARDSAEATGEDVQALALQLRATAQTAFADWWYLHSALDINERHQALYAQLHEAAQAQFAAGVASEQDALQADVERTMLREQELELRQQQYSVQAGIDALLNRAAETSVRPPGPLPPVAPAPPLAALQAYALAQHPELRALQFQEQAASEQVTLAQKSRFPNFAINASYNSMWPSPAMRPMIGVSINVPLDQGKRRAEMDASRALVHRTEESLADLTAHLDSDLATAYSGVKQSKQSLSLYRDQLLPLAQSTLQVARTEYAAGRGSFLDIITAEQSQLSAELGTARAEAELFKRAAELGRLAGTSLPIQIPRPGQEPRPDTPTPE